MLKVVPPPDQYRMVGYVRVSTDEQAASGLGLLAQREAIDREAQHRGWRLVRVYEDLGASARSLERRPGLAEALESLATGQADGLVVAKLDRLTRSVADFATLLNRFGKQGWMLVALDLNIDTSTPAGEMLANTLANVSQFERRLIAQRTRDALRQKQAQGFRLGRPVAIAQDVEARIVARRVGGATMQQIANELNSDGVATARSGQRWNASTIHRVLARNGLAGTRGTP